MGEMRGHRLTVSVCKLCPVCPFPIVGTCDTPLRGVTKVGKLKTLTADPFRMGYRILQPLIIPPETRCGTKKI